MKDNQWFRILSGFLFLFLLGLFSLSGCEKNTGKETETSLPRIVTTTGMLGDAVRNIVGEKAEVMALMGPGVDPHLYKATQGDLSRLTDADIIFYNGLHLEGKMAEVFEKLARKKKVIPISSGLSTEKIRKSADFADALDPHIWFDVSLWGEGVSFLADTLSSLMPENAEFFQANANGYRNKLDSLHSWIIAQVATIPKEGRVLITAHDAFGYFGRAYDIEVKGLQGISTQSEFGLKDVTNLVDFIVSRKIKAVFVETSVSSKSIEAVIQGCVQKGHPVQIGGSLFSDAMGNAGTPEGTYAGMVRSNVNTIVKALK